MGPNQQGRFALFGLLCIAVAALAAGQVGAAIVAPAVRALELPAGVTSISATDPLLAPILAATSTVGSAVTNDLGTTVLPVGKTSVTWRETTTGATLTKYIYLYPHGWQVLGRSSNLRTFEHNGCRHIFYDKWRRVHVIYNDGANVWYRLATRYGDRLNWQTPFQINDASTPIGISVSNGTRGMTFGMKYDAAGNVILQCTWSGVSRNVYSRRLIVAQSGAVTATGAPINTGLIGTFQAIVADASGTFHLAVEQYSAMLYANSTDGVNWVLRDVWYPGNYQCSAFRFPNLLLDAQDRLHLVWQAESYWWFMLYAVRDPQTQQWAAPVNVLDGVPGWAPPTSGQVILSAYPNIVFDDRQNLHLAWHGSIYSNMFGWDDTFYMKKPYNAATDTWGPWTDYVCLHRRDHFNNGQGEDGNHSWVPSLAYVPGSNKFYALFMYGLLDDEVANPDINVTEGGLKTYDGTQWLAGYQNVTQTPGMRSWYMNLPSQVLVDPNGHAWLDMMWADGTWVDNTLDDYNIIFRRMDLGGGLTGDTNGDGYVNVGDLQILVASWGRQTYDQTYNLGADINNDGYVNVGDLQILVARWGATG